MPRVLVTTDDRKQVLMDELATLDRIEPDKPSGDQLIERLVWSIHDAERAQKALQDAVKAKPRSNRKNGVYRGRPRSEGLTKPKSYRDVKAS